MGAVPGLWLFIWKGAVTSTALWLALIIALFPSYLANLEKRHLENTLERHLLLGNCFCAFENENPSLLSTLSEVCNQEKLRPSSLRFIKRKRHLNKTLSRKRDFAWPSMMLPLLLQHHSTSILWQLWQQEAGGEGQRGPVHTATSTLPLLLLV